MPGNFLQLCKYTTTAFENGFRQAKRVYKGVRKRQKIFSVSMGCIQHKIPTNLKGFVPYYPYIISETVGDYAIRKTSNTFLNFPTSFGWTSLETQDYLKKFELPHISNTGVG